MPTKVRTTKRFEKDLDRMPDHIALAFQTWVESVELLGIREVRKYKSYPFMGIVEGSARLGFQKRTELFTLKLSKGLRLLQWRSVNMRTRRAKDILGMRLGPLTFGGFLRSCRTSQDKSQTEMADFLGIGRSTLCDMEKGRQGVSPKLAGEIAHKCGLSVKLAVELAIKDLLKRSGLKFDNVQISGIKRASGE